MKNQKSKVFRTAWQILRSGNASSFKDALKKSWTICKISYGINTTINFVKEGTGELRTANAIQIGSMDTINKGFIRFVELINGVGQWRSFRIQNLQNF